MFTVEVKHTEWRCVSHQILLKTSTGLLQESAFEEWPHQCVSCPIPATPRLCTASFCEVSKPLLSRNWGVSFSWLCWAQCTGIWPCLPPWIPAKAGLCSWIPWSMHLTASPWCQNWPGGQTRTCPFLSLQAAGTRKYPRRAPGYTFTWTGRRFLGGLRKQQLCEVCQTCVWRDADNCWWSTHQIPHFTVLL